MSISLPAVSDVYSWGSPYVTSPGGVYRLCWCAGSPPGENWFNCESGSYHRTDAGTLDLIGPAPLEQIRTCVAGQMCGFGGVTGHLLGDGDRVWILDTCANNHFN
jgi:hypothetical protein